MSWRKFLKSNTEDLRVEMVLSPTVTPHKTIKTLKTSEIGNENIPVTASAEWQHDFCTAHAEFNRCRGSCPRSIDDCLISRIIDSGGNIDKLRTVEIGHGITTDVIIDEWLNMGESAEELLTNPTWLVCMAAYRRMNQRGSASVHDHGKPS